MGVIDAVRTPLGFFALVVLIVEGLLVSLAVKANGSDFTFLVRGALALMLLLVVVVATVAWARPEALSAEPKRARSYPASALEPVRYNYDVFVSAPMAAYADDDASYQRIRSQVSDIIRAIKHECGYRRIYFAGEGLESVAEFEEADISLDNDLKALNESRRFVLLYPEKIVTSSLVEAGAALAMKKPSVYHVRDRDDLPYLLANAPQAKRDGLPFIRICEFSDAAKLTDAYRHNGPEVFG